MPRDEFQPVLTPQLLLHAYSSGIFPMADAQDGMLHWIDPLMRGVLPLDGLHISRSLQKMLRTSDLHVTIDRDFETVMRACAARDETWITEELIAAYTGLHHLGYAHSVEVREYSGVLVGGLYGVTIGGAYFGESMFSNVPSASKLALVYLVARLRLGGFQLLDTQFVTDHLTSMGAQEIPRAQYHEKLVSALNAHSDWGALSTSIRGRDILQFVTHTS